MKKVKYWPQILYACVLVFLSGVTLIGVGFAGDRLAYIWYSHWLSDIGGNLNLVPPLSRWFGESYAYNNEEMLFSAFSAWLCLIAIFVWTLLFRRNDFYSIFLRLFVMFWMVVGAFCGFLIYCASLPFYYLISALNEPRTCMWYVNRCLYVAAPVTILTMVLYKLIRKKKPKASQEIGAETTPHPEA